MGLTGKRGAWTEGKAGTQHHCWVTVDARLLKHHSPTETETRWGGKGEAEVGEIKCEHWGRTVC